MTNRGCILSGQRRQKTMFLRTLSAAFILSTFFTFSRAKADPVPLQTGGVEPAMHLRVLSQQGSILGVGELATVYRNAPSLSTEGQRESRGILGLYHLAHRFFRWGVFFERAYGLRHDEDWVVDGAGEWDWSSSEGRGESLLTLDVTPRIGFQEGSFFENVVFELKSRVGINLSNQNQTLRVRPSVFWTPRSREKSSPWTFYTQYEVYFPLNYGTQSIYEKWTYFGVLKSLLPEIQLGAYVAYRSETWSASPDSLSRFPTRSHYSTTSWTSGFLMILRP